MTTTDRTWEQPEWIDAMPYDGALPSKAPATILRNLDLEHASHNYPDVQLMKVEAGEPCRVCGRGAGNAFICRQCAEEWERHLGNVPSLLEDLDLAAQRRVRFGGSEGNPVAATGGYDPTRADSVQPRHLHTRKPSHANRQAPIDKLDDTVKLEAVRKWINSGPGDLHAGAILGELRNELVGQVRAMCETFDLDVPALGSDAAGMSRWLLTQADNIRLMDDADGLIRDLDHAMQRGVLAIDAPQRPKYVCACASCGLAVWAPPGETVVTCVCGKAYDVESTRTKRILTAHDYLVTVKEAHALSKAKVNTIKSWIHRGQLGVHGSRMVEVEVTSSTGVKSTRLKEVQTVRYGDVVNLIEIDTAAGA